MCLVCIMENGRMDFGEPETSATHFLLRILMRKRETYTLLKKTDKYYVPDI